MSSRVQLALNVNDIGEAVAFYSWLFGAEPAKVRPGYANFAITEPPLKLVLLENPGQGGTLNHLGIEVADITTVDSEQARLAEAGLASVDERATTCCYAKQDKFWVQGRPSASAGRSTRSWRIAGLSTLRTTTARNAVAKTARLLDHCGHGRDPRPCCRAGPRAPGRARGFIDPSADRCLCLKLAQVFVVQLPARSSAKV